MPRKSTTRIEEGYIRSFWEEVSELERECNAVVTITLYATTQRGVFTVEMRALEMGVLVGDAPASHTITRRLPDGGTLPFAGALWDLARKLNDMVTEAVAARRQETFKWASAR